MQDPSSPSPLPSLQPMGTQPHDPIAEREACDHLSRVNGGGEMHSAILALLLTPGSRRELRAWKQAARSLPTARKIYEAVQALGPSTRLPWLETLLTRMAKTPMVERQALAESARIVMSADGQVRPIDRLQWLVMRYRLGEKPSEYGATGVSSNISDLSLHTRQQIARLTAYLSRMVPGSTPTASETWYLNVIGAWLPAPSMPPCEAPDADGLVHALAEVQTVPWMLRPVLVRAWLEAARHHNPTLNPMSADALRLMCVLLECPLPPELSRLYKEQGH